jgi:hypothetical protein
MKVKNLRVVACAVGLGWATLAAGASIPAEKLGHFAVPRLAQPPTVDGTIDPAEWAGALAVSGLASQNPGGNLLIMRPTTYFLAWDADNLYLACRTWLMPGYKPRVGGRAHNTATAHDDGMEFNLMPRGANVPPAGSDSSYKFFITCLGSHGDMGRVSVGQIFRSWQPRFRVATRQTAPGSGPLGGSWWEAEVVLPAKDFGLVGPNRAGDTWKMLLAFNHIPAFFQAAMPVNSGYFDPSGYPTFELAENTPAVQVTMDALPGLKDGVAAARVRVFNPGAQPAQVKVLAEIRELADPAAPAGLLKKDATLDVAPGQATEFVLNEKLPRDLGKNKGDFFLLVTQADRVLYRTFAFFELGYPETWVKYTPPKAAFPLSGTFNPVRNNFRLSADTYYLSDPGAAKAVHYAISREGGAKPVVEGTLDKVEDFYFTGLMDLPPMAQGRYTVDVRMELRDGTKLGPETAAFEKLDEAKAFGSWWQNKLGDPERVIPPFEPIRSQRSEVRGQGSAGESVSVLGRTYTLNALGLPAAIHSQGQPVMASPARVVVVVDGKEQAVDLGGKLKLTEKKDWRLSFRGEAAGSGLNFSATGSLEQDGLVTVSLTFAPAGKAPVAIEALRLEFPVRDDVAESLVCIGAGGNFSSHTGMLLPAGKSGRLWSTLDTGIGGSMMTVGSFYPQVWLGNEQRGLLWWADSDQGWTPVNEVPAHEVVREAGDQSSVNSDQSSVNSDQSSVAGTSSEQSVKPTDHRSPVTDHSFVTLRNNLISVPETLTGPRTLTFSYMASPFKPLPKGWRMAIYSEDGTFGTTGHKTHVDPKSGHEINGWNWLNPPSYDPAEWSALWAEHKQKADAKVREQQWRDPAAARNKDWVHTSIPMRGYGVQTSDGKVANYFRPEWGEGNYNPSMTEYLLWLADRSFREGGLRTIYWDIFYVSVMADLQAGYGYRLPDGRTQPTFHGYNLRRFMMRLYALMNDHGLTPGANVAHSSNAFPLLAFPWVDAVLDGEFVFFRDATIGDFVDFYPSARMRAMATSHNWGTQNSWMMLNHITDQTRYWREHRIYTDWQRMHDTWRGQDNRVPPDSILEWGLNDARLVYTPYWRSRAATGGSSNLLVSTWTLPDRALLLVFNADGKAARDGKVTVDLKGLGLPTGEITVKEIGGAIGNGLPADTPKEPEVAFDPASGTLAVPGLQPHTARYIGIRVQAPADLERVRREFAAVGHGAALTEAMLDWGLVGNETAFLPPGQATGVKSETPATQAAMWRLTDRVLLAVVNTGEQEVPVTVGVDLDKLGLTPQLPWQEFIRVRDFDGGNANLDFHARQLSLGVLKPGQVRRVGIRRY